LDKRLGEPQSQSGRNGEEEEEEEEEEVPLLPLPEIEPSGRPAYSLITKLTELPPAPNVNRR
jgi:hypothetical protein